MIGPLLRATLLGGLGMLLVGCVATPQDKTGFISTYKNLEPVSPTFMRYRGSDAVLAKYDKYIIDPVEVRFYDPETRRNVEAKDVQHLQQFLYGELKKNLAEKVTLVAKPGPGVARVRIAITNLKAATPARDVLPQTKLMGMGLGETSAEAEIVDSVTGEQLSAAIESDQGSRFSLSGLSDWGGVEAVMTDWGKRIAKRVDEARKPAGAAASVAP